jgi:DNA-binding GntR family transcriptional regulator
MQSAVVRVQRDNISDVVAGELRNMIVDGRLPAGERINEVKLSAQLGISRTPLREALARLANEGAVKSVARIGYTVLPLTLEEFEQIYAIRPILDPEALRRAGLPSADKLKRLYRLNLQMDKVKEVERIISLDDEFHLELISGCPNKVLIDLIKQNIRQTRRYEIALMREHEYVLSAISNHVSILHALDAGALETACSALRTNLEAGFDPIASWLKERESAAKV